MGKKSISDTVAVIDIASNELRLKIAERNKGDMKILESLNYPISLGRDTFHDGKISFEKVDKTCTTIKNFLTVTTEYGVNEIKTIATTAVRESKNKDYILDQIKIKTGLSVNVIDDSQEKIYINKFSLSVLQKEYKQSALMVHIGSGNIGISVIQEAHIVSTQNIRIGSLRLSELFENILDYSQQYSLVVEEYLQTFIESIETIIPKNIKYFVTTGNEIEMISDLCGSEKHENYMIIYKNDFSKLYKDIKNKLSEKIAVDYNITVDKADVLLPALIIYNKMFKYTKADQILCPQISLSDALIYEMLFPDKNGKLTKEFDISTILSANSIASRFNLEPVCYEKVERFSTKIFDKLKKIHGLGSRERLLLRISSILQNVGKFVNVKGHYIHSYNIIKGLDIVGLNEYETDVVATVCLYHSRITPKLSDENYAKLSQKERVLVSKLSAILRLADSLTRSNASKFDDIEVKLSEEGLIIFIETYKNTELEEWTFRNKSTLFEEVFGIKALIKKRKVM